MGFPKDALGKQDICLAGLVYSAAFAVRAALVRCLWFPVAHGEAIHGPSERMDLMPSYEG